jgi:hypothetical protein
VALVIILARAEALQCLGWVNVHPYRRSDVLPETNGVLRAIMRDTFLNVARVAHRDEIVRNPLPGHRCVVANRLV